MCSGTLGKVTGEPCRLQPASSLINRKEHDSQVQRMFVLAWWPSSEKWELGSHGLPRMMELMACPISLYLRLQLQSS
jgi:hypothetical protein